MSGFGRPARRASSIKLDDGSRKVFRDDPGDEGGYGYALLDYYPAFHRFVVTNVGVDSGVTSVVDGRTGKTTDYGALFPYFSPDGHWIILADAKDSSGDAPVFSLVAADDPKRAPIWSSAADTTTLSTRAFAFTRWESNTRVRFALGSSNTPIFLVKTSGGRWHYDLGDDPEPPPAARDKGTPMEPKP